MHTIEEVEQMLEDAEDEGERIDELLKATSRQREDISELREELDALEEEVSGSGK